jgi:hypothetical protein
VVVAPDFADLRFFANHLLVSGEGLDALARDRSIAGKQSFRRLGLFAMGADQQIYRAHIAATAFIV